MAVEPVFTTNIIQSCRIVDHADHNCMAACQPILPIKAMMKMRVQVRSHKMMMKTRLVKVQVRSHVPVGLRGGSSTSMSPLPPAAARLLH